MAITASFNTFNAVQMMDAVEIHDHEGPAPAQFLELENAAEPGLKQRPPQRGD